MTTKARQIQSKKSDIQEKAPEPGVDTTSYDETPATNPCGDPTRPDGDPNAPYRLPGPQVEFSAAYWWINAKLRIPTINEIKAKLGAKLQPFPRDVPTLKKEIRDLKDLERKRNDPLNLRKLSPFINLQDPPFGAVFNASPQRIQFRVDNVNDQDTRISRLPEQLVLTGRELARMFEIETPGLLHRQALNWLLYQRADVSPPRQARIWAAFDLTIYAALIAAWHFKWEERRPLTRFRQRPWEYDHSLNVLFDREVNDRGNGDGKPRTCPCPTPGTPRHPAYPSGHSTYSAAGSRILQYFFRDKETVNRLDLLANNIGEARLWAGVHWPSDHEFGQAVGRATAEVIIDQLEADCIPSLDKRTCEEAQNDQPPNDAQLKEAKARRGKRPCPDADTQDEIPPRKQVRREDRVRVY